MRQPHSLRHARPALLRHLQPGYIQRSQQQLVGAGGLQKPCRLPQPAPVHPMAAHMQHGSLGHGTQQLVGALGSHIRPQLYGLQRQLVTKAQMGTMGLIHQQQHACPVHRLCNSPQITAIAIIGGINRHQCPGSRMGSYGTLHGRQAQPHGNAQPCIHLRLNIDRHSPCHYHAPYNGAMGIPGYQHLVPRRQCSQQHGVNRPCSAVDNKHGILSTPQLRCQSLCRLDAALRLMEIIQLLHKGNLLPQAILRNQLPEKPMSPQPLLVAGSMKSKGAVPCIFLHCMRNRRLVLIQHILCISI